MQLSRLYSNKPSLFETIDFNRGAKSNVLNVIYGAVTDLSDDSKDSHNLGKSTLIHVIDFMFLKSISSSNHFFETHQERFKDLILYLEIGLNSGEFVTVKRSIDFNTQISFKMFEVGLQNWTEEDENSWDHQDLSLEASRELLDGMLNMQVVSPYGYRKALTYFLRTQDDYKDVLQLQKFQTGRDIYWKPFVMNLLGFDEGPVDSKYKLDKTIEETESEKKKKEDELQVDEQDLSRLGAEIQNQKSQLSKTESQLDRFEFSDEERRLMHELVDEIETEISDINEILYNTRIDIRNIEQALSRKIAFKVDDIATIFEESNLHFPDQIKKSYEELVGFNKSLTHERNVSLRARRKQLLETESEAQQELNIQDKKRQEYRSILTNSDTLDKFKSLQRSLAEQRANLTYLEGQYQRLHKINDLEIEINGLKRKRSEVVDAITLQIQKGAEPKELIAEYFNEYCKKVLDHDGLFFVRQNSVGNVEFPIELKEPVGSKASRQSEGKSYKQMICALFDLAILKAYERSPFYHFVYHDGILEGLDDRKKRLFLDVVRDVISGGNIQYILSVIDSDVPRDAEGKRMEFNEDEIILQLHDGGREGRLFKMAEF